MLTNDDYEEIGEMKRLLAINELKDLGKLRYLLGIEMAHSMIGLILNLRKYTFDVLKEIGKLGCMPVATLIEANRKLNIKYEKCLIKEEKNMYQRLVGKLISYFNEVIYYLYCKYC